VVTMHLRIVVGWGTGKWVRFARCPLNSAKREELGMTKETYGRMMGGQHLDSTGIQMCGKLKEKPVEDGGKGLLFRSHRDAKERGCGARAKLVGIIWVVH